MMLHLGQNDVAERIQNAWLKTLEDGVHTYDIYSEKTSTRKVSTSEFADAVIARLGHKPMKLAPVHYATHPPMRLPVYIRKKSAAKSLVGIDLFVHWSGTDPNALAELIHQMDSTPFQLEMITNRGIKVYPDGFPETFCTDHWRCRFAPKPGARATHAGIIELQVAALAAGIDFIKTEHLYAFDGKAAFSLGQGQ
jgi:isocitrate dehydrogenase